MFVMRESVSPTGRRRRSVLALQKIIRQSIQRFSIAITEYRQRVMRLTREASGFGARFLQSYNCGIGRFFCRHIFAGALAQYFRRLCHVENIVDDLESETQALPELCNR